MGNFRVLHISDWHLGKNLGRVDRRPDHAEAIEQIIAIARDRTPDLIVHCGDLFDGFRPSTADIRVAVDALLELADVAPVLVVAGNHDSGPLFELLGKVLGHRSITMIDKPRRRADGGVVDYLIPGGGRCYVAAIPFVHANRTLGDSFETPEQRMSAYADRLRLVQQALGQELNELTDPVTDVSMIACHLHITGAQAFGSERQLHVSDSYAVRATEMPPVNYIACGHIHRAQKLPGAVESRYAGSAVPLDFGEQDDIKQVALVTMTPGRPTIVEELELSLRRPLLRLEGTLAQLAELADDVGEAICRVIVHCDTRDPQILVTVRQLLPDATLLEVIERIAGADAQPLHDDGSDGSDEESLEDLFETFLAGRPLADAPKPMIRETFEELLASVQERRDADFAELVAASGEQP